MSRASGGAFSRARVLAAAVAIAVPMLVPTGWAAVAAASPAALADISTPTSPVIVSTDRIAGADRYETSALIADRFGTANAVVVANGENYKQGFDALSANYLAGRAGAPIILTGAGAVSSKTLAAVRDVLADAHDATIYVMGQSDSVSSSVVDQIEAAASAAADGTVAAVRVGGSDRYATSALAASQIGSVSGEFRFDDSGSLLNTAFLVSGQVNADALAAGPVSNAWRIPVLLTSKDEMPQSVQQVIASQQIKQLIVLGGTDRVSAAVLQQAQVNGVTSVKRIAGSDRFQTAAQLYTFVRESMQGSDSQHYGAGAGNGDTVYLANGLTGFPDALSVGPLAAQWQDALLTVPPTSLPESAASFLSSESGLTKVVALGQPATVAQSVVDAAVAALRQTRDNSSARVTTLGAGMFTVGDDVPPGRYVVTPVAGGIGNFIVHSADDSLVASEILGTSNGLGVPSVTLTLAAGDEIVIAGLASVTFTPATTTLRSVLTTGQWEVGLDLAAGRYVATGPAGQAGNFVVYAADGSLVSNEILGDADSLGVPSVTLTYQVGDRIEISGMSSVAFAPAVTALRTSLTTGNWNVGVDIAAGRYVAAPAAGESGNFVVYDAQGHLVVNEILDGTDDPGGLGVPNVTVTLDAGGQVEISGISTVTFTPKS